jgi:hypothetical protein
MTPEERLEMLKWLSARNAHMPLSELAFLLGLPVVKDHGDEKAHASLLPMR